MLHEVGIMLPSNTLYCKALHRSFDVPLAPFCMQSALADRRLGLYSHVKPSTMMMMIMMMMLCFCKTSLSHLFLFVSSHDVEWPLNERCWQHSWLARRAPTRRPL